MRRASEKMFVDFAGQRVDIVDPDTGEISEAHLFVAVLGASNYTYAEAFPGEDLPSWITAHVHAFEFFGGLSEIVVPDNLKSGVTRPKRPLDKAKVESAVLVAERWILAALRNHRFFSIAELNKAIRQKLTDLNNRPMQVLKKTLRREIETRLVESARFRVDEIQDVYWMMEERSEGEVSRKHSEEHDELMQLPEVQEQIAEIIHKHWEGWVDESIPALGGETPREAETSPDGRESVEALLREAERDRGQDPFMDEANRKGTRWVRELLGLNDQ